MNSHSSAQTCTTQQVPNCAYCLTPLTGDEFDLESESFFSAHRACSTVNSAGPWAVTTSYLGQPKAAAKRRYTTSRRADEEARYLASNNRSEYTFTVTHMQDGTEQVLRIEQSQHDSARRCKQRGALHQPAWI